MAAMRATWTGAIAFGLVSVNCKLYKSTSSHDVSFKQVHKTDGGAIRYVKTCADCGEPVQQSDIAKCHDGVIVTEDELSQLQTANDKTISVLQFVDMADIDLVSFESSYYVSPDKQVNGYALLAEAMRSTDKVALCRFQMRSRASLAVLRLQGDTLVLTTLAWADEVRKPDLDLVTKAAQVELKPQEVAVAKMLVESMTGPFDATSHRDDYTVAVKELVDAKQAGKPAPHVELPPSPEEVDGLLAALQASLAAKKQAVA